jgi:hypothetical protein
MPTGSSLSNDQLLALARARLADGQLPVVISTRVDAGYGVGHACTLCNQLITRAHTEYDVRPEPAGSVLVFHLRCHQAWQLECIRRMPG